MAKVSQIAHTRQPIVAILGHVDHGKTTLLDYIRKTHVAAREAGGITQQIGAYQAVFKNHKLTFIDTPGHAAFSKMRSRGASTTDIGVLVVAADDGVKPQTIESIKHLQSAKVPFIVALTKMDTPGANPETAKAQLTEHQVFVEGYGGNTPVVALSAKTGEHVDDLLETILLLSELEEIKSDPQAPLQAVVIEAKKDSQKGIIVSVIVKEGTLRVNDEIKTTTASGKVRALFDENNNRLEQILPGEPALIMGFHDIPEVGEIVTRGVGKNDLAPLANITAVPVETDKKLKIILRSDTRGTLEAIRESLSDDVMVMFSGTGEVNESDVLLASSTGSIIFGFNVKVSSSVAKLAEIEGVTVKTYKIIYELLEYIEKKVLKIIEPTIDEETIGSAEVLKVFEINGSKIAGCRITTGVISVGDQIHLNKPDGTTKNARVKFLKVGKDDVKKVNAGAECGILLAPNLDVREKDVIISYRKIQEEE